jgi:uncharacterized membrane protein
MDRSIVSVFLDEKTAKQGAHTLKEICTAGAATLVGMSVVSKDRHGKLAVAEVYCERTHGAVVAALISALAGWAAGGPVAALIFAAGGALIGLAADLIHRGGHIELVERVLRELSPGRSAVIAHVTEAKDESTSAIMKGLGGKVTEH